MNANLYLHGRQEDFKAAAADKFRVEMQRLGLEPDFDAIGTAVDALMDRWWETLLALECSRGETMDLLDVLIRSSRALAPMNQDQADAQNFTWREEWGASSMELLRGAAGSENRGKAMLAEINTFLRTDPRWANLRLALRGELRPTDPTPSSPIFAAMGSHPTIMRILIDRLPKWRQEAAQRARGKAGLYGSNDGDSDGPRAA